MHTSKNIPLFISPILHLADILAYKNIPLYWLCRNPLILTFRSIDFSAHTQSYEYLYRVFIEAMNCT